MNKILTIIMIFLGVTYSYSQEEVPHVHSSKCYSVPVETFADGMGISEKDASYFINKSTKTNLNKSSSTIQNTFYEGIFYYPGAYEDANMTKDAFEQTLRDTFEKAINQYLSYLDQELTYKVNYVGEMPFFSENDFSNKIWALSATGMGNYDWFLPLKNSFHITCMSFIVPEGYPINSNGDQAVGYAQIVANSAQNGDFYFKSYYPSVIIDGKLPIISHEFAHNCGVNHTLAAGDLGGDENGYASVVQGKYGTANMISYNGGAETVNAPSAPGFSWNGVSLGSNQENSLSVINDEITTLSSRFEETYICASDSAICEGSTLLLDATSNGNITLNSLSNNISVSGMEVTVNSSGMIEVVAQQSGTLYFVRDTIYIEALSHETIDSTINLTSGESITLPDGTILSDQDNGLTGSYTVEGGANNGCDLIVNWSVEVVSGTIDISKDNRIRVYPNPFNNQIKIETREINIKKVQIYDLTGKLLIEQKFSHSIETSLINTGTYLIKLIDDQNNIFVQKLTKLDKE